MIFGCLIDGHPSWIGFVEIGRCAAYLYTSHYISPKHESCPFLTIIYVNVFHISLLVWGFATMKYNLKKQ